MVKISFVYRLWVILAAIIIMAYGFISALYPRKYIDYIEHYSQCYNVDSNIIASIINCESGYKRDAKSKAGAIGLMQIMPSTAEYLAKLLGIKEFSEDMLYVPKFNIMIGTYYVSVLYKKYMDIPTMLASYNAGPGNVDRWLRDKEYSMDGLKLNITPYAETNAYIEKVQKNFEIYSKLNKKH